jgi:hypothetical protein
MRKRFQTSLIIFCTLIYLPVQAEQIRELAWKDLIPAYMMSQETLVKALAKLTPEQQEKLYWIIAMRESRARFGVKDKDTLAEEIDKEMPELKRVGIDIKKELAKRNAFRTSVNKELNGQRVRMGGYLLPLEVSGTEVIEFLLVPYVGACIHVPPPPPNQIIYVKAEKGVGYKSRNQFDTVLVTGVISARSIVKDLFLKDGSADINIGYSIKASRIEPYK